MKNLLMISLLIWSVSCSGQKSDQPVQKSTSVSQSLQVDTATFAGGCFWCIEASFDQINGVISAVSGYAGGSAKDANYKKVSTGTTGHAEAVEIYFDPKVVSYDTLLSIFFTAHDPTQLNRQGPDVGTQYRSAIFYHNEAQKAAAQRIIAREQKKYQKKIVTELAAYDTFYAAEDYHQNYEENNPFNPYILNVSRPKIERVKKEFEYLIKE